jgi:hypothetical protein
MNHSILQEFVLKGPPEAVGGCGGVDRVFWQILKLQEYGQTTH